MGKGWKAAKDMLACVRSMRDAENGKGSYNSMASLTEVVSTTTDSPLQSSDGVSTANSCAICLESMKPSKGRAIFTAECLHTFHFSCIASSVRHGNMLCPVCRARWIDMPWQANSLPAKTGSRDPWRRRSREQHVPADPVIQILNETIANAAMRLNSSIDTLMFDDDEMIRSIPNFLEISTSDTTTSTDILTLSAQSEISSVPASVERNPFTILVNLRAPPKALHRASIDLVTVLDVSGSMAGSKLLLLKSAMEFVIRSLSSHDRLSVISFSSSARRVVRLVRMTQEGKEIAIRAVNSLSANGGTNIGDGLKKAAKVLEDRRYKNPVSSVILLSDGQDTMRRHSSSSSSSTTSSSSSSPFQSILRRFGVNIPVHSFGFGSDHDAATMHSIAASSAGGTFSFVRAEDSVQDAFAQCIGGLLSVAAQVVEIRMESLQESVEILKIQSGGFKYTIAENCRSASIELGDLYADEGRDVLVQISLPATKEENLLRISCRFSLPGSNILHSQEILHTMVRCGGGGGDGDEDESVVGVMSLEVDKQRNRLVASESIAAANILVDSGNLTKAQESLLAVKGIIEDSPSYRAGDVVVMSLTAEICAILGRMKTRSDYEASGRAYALSAHSSHSQQRATSRVDGGDDDDVDGGYTHSYQTTSMVDMLHLSQTFARKTDSSSSAAAAAVAVAVAAPSSLNCRVSRLLSRSSKKNVISL